MQTFELTEQHITLLRAAYIGWDDTEFGAPAIDCKRPYGNSDVPNDIARLLHPEYTDMDEDEQERWLEQHGVRLRTVHEETQTALQIVLSTGQWHPGRYIRDTSERRDWRPEGVGPAGVLYDPLVGDGFTGTPHRWWVSWYGVGAFEYHGPWWASGYELGGLGRTTFCAAVVASSEDDARRIITQAHDDPSAEIEWRFTEPQADDWEPFTDRFPRAEWMRWPGVAGENPYLPEEIRTKLEETYGSEETRDGTQ